MRWESRRACHRPRPVAQVEEERGAQAPQRPLRRQVGGLGGAGQVAPVVGRVVVELLGEQLESLIRVMPLRLSVSGSVSERKLF